MAIGYFLWFLLVSASDCLIILLLSNGFNARKPPKKTLVFAFRYFIVTRDSVDMRYHLVMTNIAMKNHHF